MIKDAGFAAHYTAQLFLCKARSGEKEVLVWTYSTPSPFLSFPLLSPPLPIPPNQLGCLGEHCKLPQRGPQMHVCDILSPENGLFLSAITTKTGVAVIGKKWRYVFMPAKHTIPAYTVQLRALFLRVHVCGSVAT